MKRTAVAMTVLVGAAALWAPNPAHSLPSTAQTKCNGTHLLVGMPGARHGAGAVEVHTHIASATVQLLREGSGSLAANPAQPGAAFGSTISASAINIDCHYDLAIGIPDLTVNGVPRAGGVQIMFGTAAGFTAGPLITRDSPGVPGDPATNEHFGDSVIMEGSYHPNTGNYEVFIGVPGATVVASNGSTETDAGQMLELSYPLGPSAQQQATSADTYNQGEGAPGQPVANAHFGASLGFIGGNLVVGAPDETVSGKTDAGWWGVVNINDKDEGSIGTSYHGTQAGEHLGASITGDGGPMAGANDNLVPMVGAPGATVHGHRSAGAVYYYQDSELDYISGPQRLTQDSPHIPGTAATGNHFGATVANLSNVESAIGVPGQTVKGHKGAGAVIVLDSYDGETTRYSEIDQATKHVQGKPEAGDHFGQSLGYTSHGRIDGVDPLYTLAIGDPGEGLGKTNDAGAVELVPVSKTNPRLSPQRSSVLTRPKPHAGDEYGASLAPSIL